MKHLKFLLVFVCSFGMAQIQTPQPSPSTKVEQVVGLTKVTLEYSRPAMRERIISTSETSYYIDCINNDCRNN